MLKDTTLIVNISIGRFSGRKFDKRATATVETTHKTQGKTGQYSKQLLPGAKELAEIGRQEQAIRTYFYDQTLPWLNDGARILAATNYLNFTNEFRKLKSKFEQSVADFIREYPYLKAEAQVKLGDLYRETEYPTQNELESSFHCDVQFMPVPALGDFRVEILDSEKEAFLRNMHNAETNAMRECWERLYKVVNQAATKLHSRDAIFRDSLIENIMDMCSLLPRLNYSDDPKLEGMRQEVETLVKRINPDSLRTNHMDRQNTANALDELTDKMSAFMSCSKPLTNEVA